MVGRALTHWHTIGGGGLPSRSEFESGDMPFSPVHLFYIRLSDTEADDRIVDAGLVLTEALGMDPTGRAVGDILPSARERGLAFHRAAAAHGRPVAESGHSVGAAGEPLMYRCLLLPLRRDRLDRQFVAGAFSFKSVQ